MSGGGEFSRCSLAVAAGLFAANTMISGEWNYQGGERRHLQLRVPVSEAVVHAGGISKGRAMARDEALTDVIFQKSVFLTNLTEQPQVVLRRPLRRTRRLLLSGGLRARGVPARAAASACRGSTSCSRASPARSRCSSSRSHTPGSAAAGRLATATSSAPTAPFLFLLPPIQRAWVALIPWVVGGLFMAKLVLKPFTTSVRPGEYADAGPLRIFPVELSNMNDIADHDRSPARTAVVRRSPRAAATPASRSTSSIATPTAAKTTRVSG